MKKTLAIIALASMLWSCTNNVSQEINLKSNHDSASYAIGVLIAKQNASNNLDSLNHQIIKLTMDKFMEEGDSNMMMSLEECQQFYSNYATEISTRKAKAENASFLEENKTKDGVKTTESGLQYKIIREGSGAIPGLTDSAVCHYTGKLVDGRVFDSSVKRGAPITFPLTGVIKGWTEALQMMPVGSKWELYIPYDLAYGERGNGRIPPYATLIFELDLLDIKAAEVSEE
jgi:FKBP-type peptidyl-prolyl cis-trans isomerase FklB